MKTGFTILRTGTNPNKANPNIANPNSANPNPSPNPNMLIPTGITQP